MFAGVNFFTGQLFDIERITAAAQAGGIVVGFDLAHVLRYRIIRYRQRGNSLFDFLKSRRPEQRDEAVQKKWLRQKATASKPWTGARLIISVGFI